MKTKVKGDNVTNKTKTNLTALAIANPYSRRQMIAGSAIWVGNLAIRRNLELVPNRRIVQAWRVVSWPEGIYSIARFELQAQGSGTRVIFDHAGFPSDLAEHLESGWQENYWKLLRKYLD